MKTILALAMILLIGLLSASICQASYSDPKYNASIQFDLPVFTPDMYQVDVFDCSDMTTKDIELLQNQGYRSWYCRGPMYGDMHCWVGLKVDNETWYIESTEQSIVYPTDSDYVNYNNPIETVGKVKV